MSNVVANLPVCQPVWHLLLACLRANRDEGLTVRFHQLEAVVGEHWDNLVQRAPELRGKATATIVSEFLSAAEYLHVIDPDPGRDDIELF